MALAKHYEEALTPLTELGSRVREFAALCYEDHRCTFDNEHDVHFVEKDFDEDETSCMTGNHVLLTIQDRQHLFTDWSYSQLLSHLGTREKWFQSVTKEQQAAELDKRVHTLRDHRLRTMRSTEEGFGLMRGLVSNV